MYFTKSYQNSPKRTSGNHSLPVVTKTHQWLPVFLRVAKNGYFLPLFTKTFTSGKFGKKKTKEKEPKRKINKKLGCWITGFGFWVHGLRF